MQFSAAIQQGITSVLASIPTMMEQTQDVLSSTGRIVLTIAATLFLAYVVLMTGALAVSSVRGWVQAALERADTVAIHARRGAVPALAERS